MVIAENVVAMASRAYHGLATACYLTEATMKGLFAFSAVIAALLVVTLAQTADPGQYFSKDSVVQMHNDARAHYGNTVQPPAPRRRYSLICIHCSTCSFPP